jgi:hypothetical protein
MLLVGNNASHFDQVMFFSALWYVRIWALGMPAMVAIGTGARKTTVETGG